jgi:beta-glucosidase
MRTIVEGVAGKVSPSTRMQYRQGAMLTSDNLNSIDWFSGQAQDAEATIVVLGLTLLLEGEEGESIASPAKGDILDMKLPESQLKLLRKINEKARKGNKKVITVVCAGMPLDLTEVSELSDAVLYAWYPGEKGGDAVADIIFGNVSPSGKLPITFPKSIEQLPDYESYSMEGRTYKYMTEKPLYPFGYGLSYTKLHWEQPSVSNTKVKKNGQIDISLNIKNEGSVDGEEVVQVYISLENDKENLPQATLIDFKRVTVNKGNQKNVTFSVPYEAFSYYNNEGEKRQHKGNARIMVGNASPGNRSTDLGARLYSFEIEVK